MNETRLERMLDGFADEIESALRYHRSRGKGGQQVRPSGDFFRCPVSALKRLQWWARELKSAAEHCDSVGR